jgi:hypothetical protein
MPVLVKDPMFDYLAHITREDGSVVELSGSIEKANHNDVYLWLLNRATELDGFLVSQQISESGIDVPWNTKVSSTPVLPAPKPKPVLPVRVEVPSVFVDRNVFGEYTHRYTGAVPLKYKSTEE